MFEKRRLSTAVSTAVGLAVSSFLPAVASAQEEMIEEVVVTGSRITAPGVVSSSPVASVSAAEIQYQQSPSFEFIMRGLPSTIPGDGSAVNNGTAGQATIDLRGLGPERNLVLMDGKRMTPFNYDGEVDTNTIPTALIERVDVITGGASAVYGSDAIAGAINVILKKDFEGVELDLGRTETGDNDGRTNWVNLTLGANVANDRGNVVLNVGWNERKSILLGDRDEGLLGIDSNTGGGYDDFLAGRAPTPPPAGCGGPDVVDITGSGSTTAIPTRFALVGYGPANGQFRDDGTIGSECSLFNFNPWNYFQTPNERYNATAVGHFDLTDAHSAYANINFANNSVVQQVAPSGTFGAAFMVPLNNAFLSDQARQYMINAGNDALAAGALNPEGLTNWDDTNGNGVVDDEDYLSMQLRRRTVELGGRTEEFDSDYFQMTVGMKGELGFLADWGYDVSFQYGESNLTTVRDGYTNLTNIQNALDSSDGVNCANGDSTCVPLNLFGGFGTITPEMAGYARAIALQRQEVEQTIYSLTFDGPVEFLTLPTADSPMAIAFGYEHRNEAGSLEPDECLKLAPASCQGGAGGNLLPIAGDYTVEEFFIEGFWPLIEGMTLVDELNFEYGWRTSDYTSVGTVDTWKLGLNWRPVDSLLVRVMQQEANRAPNVGELFSPVVTGLDNAQIDPCSVANAGNITPELEALCISTGMTAAQVGTVQDIVSNQINTFDGSDPGSPPDSEQAETFTAGIVWTPDFNFTDYLTLSVDYYDIDITDIIGEFSAQEVLNGCYVAAQASECAKIKRIGGDLTLPASGVELFTTNLDYLQAEGLDIGFNFGFTIGRWGNLDFSGNITHYLTQESQSSSITPVLDCKGFYGTSCDPLPETVWSQRTTWNIDNFTVSLNWMHFDSVDAEPPERAGLFAPFRSIDSYDYFDLFASYDFSWKGDFKVSLGVKNLTDEDPPIVGNDAGSTSFNNGNTFPSTYTVLGRIYTAGFNYRF
ncbi:TonB-dependent receptor plug domain-containing protein [Parahaliea maris]|uniref:TonB-dependent receptor plug domain-containing protein n=1 Tax=Parahaliea maris TaxID=2716870 RepID=A0A5C9A4U0_9GAMM|nr:TonB-dependent receptor [Parahaliea maris]TXS95953.1 TonB-dependent receptor plug domain-containing protein [Parahaliea maris]